MACPVIAYAQGTADLCAAYGLASVMHEFGDVSGAATIAVCARAALTVRCRARTFLGRLLLARWPACERARSRSPRHTSAARVVQPPAARRSSHALRRKWAGVESMPLCRYATMSLRRYATMPPRRYATYTPLCREARESA